MPHDAGHNPSDGYMMLVLSESPQVQCGRCYTRFRVTARQGVMPASHFPCPRCSHLIEVSEAMGWSSLKRAQLFGVDSSPPRPQRSRAPRARGLLPATLAPSPRFSFKPVGSLNEEGLDLIADAPRPWPPQEIAPPERHTPEAAPSSLVWRRSPTPPVHELPAEPPFEPEHALSEPSEPTPQTSEPAPNCEPQAAQGPSKWRARHTLNHKSFSYRAASTLGGLTFGRRIPAPTPSVNDATSGPSRPTHLELDVAQGDDEDDDLLRWGRAMISARQLASLHAPPTPAHHEPEADSRASTLRPNQSRFPLLAHQAQFIDVDFESTTAPLAASAAENETTKAYLPQEVRRIYANAPASLTLEDADKTRPFASTWRLPESAEEVIALSEEELLAVDERALEHAEPPAPAVPTTPAPVLASDPIPTLAPAPQAPQAPPVQAEDEPEPLPAQPTPTTQDPFDEVLAKLEVDEADPPELGAQVARPYGRAGLWVGVFVLIALSIVLGAVASKRFNRAPAERAAISPVVEAAAVVPARGLETRHADALKFAQTTIHLAALQDTSSPRARHQIAKELLSDGRSLRALGLLETLWAEGQRQPQVAASYAKALWSQGRATSARQVALQGLVHHAQDPELIATFNEAIARDESLKAPTVTITLESGHADKIYPLGGGKSVSLRMTRQGDSVYAFKPAQVTWREGWQAEVAAYTLCQILACDFEIPSNRMARISQEDFYALYERVRSEKQTRYREERFQELLWVSEEDPQGQTRQYLYGTLKEWVPGFINWPIEYTEHWEPWLDGTRSLADLERVRLREALSSLRQQQGGRFYRDILRESETSGVLALGSQLSQLLTFDFVTTNWDRFSVLEAYYGANNQFAQGRFISIDNGAAFHTQPMQRVNELLPKMTRFSRRQIAALRALRPGQLDLLLFPVQTEESKLRMKIFWQQRDVLLAHVDKLIQEHGAQRVLGFP